MLGHILQSYHEVGRSCICNYNNVVKNRELFITQSDSKYKALRDREIETEDSEIEDSGFEFFHFSIDTIILKIDVEKVKCLYCTKCVNYGSRGINNGINRPR